MSSSSPLATSTAYSSTAVSTPSHTITSSPSTTPSGSSSSSSSSASFTVHTVFVGNAGYRFQPNITYANPGDVVSFFFYPSNHSVVRAAEGFPCVPYEYTYPGRTGFYSGHFLVDAGAETPVWNLTINNTDTLWYYCTAIGSCTPNGMVGVINPPSDTASSELAQQESLAIAAPYMLQPGEAAPAESATTTLSTSTPAVTSTSASSTIPVVTTITPAASPSPSPVSHSSGLSGGAIGGIVAGSVVGLILVAVLIYLCGRNSVYRQWYKSEKRTQASTESWVSQQPPMSMSQMSPAMSSFAQSPKPGAVVRERYTDARLSGTGLGSSPPSPPIPSPPLPWWVSNPEAGEWAQQPVEPSELHAETQPLAPVELDIRRPTPMPASWHLAAQQPRTAPRQQSTSGGNQYDAVRNDSM